MSYFPVDICLRAFITNADFGPLYVQAGTDSFTEFGPLHDYLTTILAKEIFDFEILVWLFRIYIARHKMEFDRSGLWAPNDEMYNYLKGVLKRLHKDAAVRRSHHIQFDRKNLNMANITDIIRRCRIPPAQRTVDENLAINDPQVIDDIEVEKDLLRSYWNYLECHRNRST
jgi:hypothetical protein